MAKISRRALVASAAALPVAGLNVTSSALAADDDKLVALAAKVDAEWARFGEAIAVTDAAQGQCEIDRANTLQDAVSDELHGAVDAMCATPARSVRGLRAKARAADTTLRCEGKAHSHGELEWSIVDDLLAMGA